MDIILSVGLITAGAVMLYVIYRFLTKNSLNNIDFSGYYPTPTYGNYQGSATDSSEIRPDNVNYEILHSELDEVFAEAAKEAEKIPAKKRAPAKKATKKSPVKKATKKATSKKITKKSPAKKA